MCGREFVCILLSGALITLNIVVMLGELCIH